MYTYCGNNPIIYIDFSGNDYYYYYGDDQERAANINIAELERKGETVHSYHIKSEKLFTKNWNLMETSKNDSIIINLHGNAEGVSYINISNLNNKHIGSLYLLSCNAGHQDNPNNPATQMFDEFDINRLVAADGTHFRDPEETTKKFLFFKWKSEIVSLSVEGDDAFNSARETYSPGSTRDSMGYVLYRREGREGNVVVESIGSKFKGISKLIKKAENS